MGRDPIENLNILLDRIFLAFSLESGELPSLLDKLFQIDIASLNEEEKSRLYRALDVIEDEIRKKREKTLLRLQELEKLKKFRY